MELEQPGTTSTEGKASRVLIDLLKTELAGVHDSLHSLEAAVESCMRDSNIVSSRLHDVEVAVSRLQPPTNGFGWFQQSPSPCGEGMSDRMATGATSPWSMSPPAAHAQSRGAFATNSLSLPSVTKSSKEPVSTPVQVLGHSEPCYPLGVAVSSPQQKSADAVPVSKEDGGSHVKVPSQTESEKSN